MEHRSSALTTSFASLFASASAAAAASEIWLSRSAIKALAFASSCATIASFSSCSFAAASSLMHFASAAVSRAAAAVASAAALALVPSSRDAQRPSASPSLAVRSRTLASAASFSASVDDRRLVTSSIDLALIVCSEVMRWTLSRSLELSRLSSLFFALAADRKAAVSESSFDLTASAPSWSSCAAVSSETFLRSSVTVLLFSTFFVSRPSIFEVSNCDSSEWAASAFSRSRFSCSAARSASFARSPSAFAFSIACFDSLASARFSTSSIAFSPSRREVSAEELALCLEVAAVAAACSLRAAFSFFSAMSSFCSSPDDSCSAVRSLFSARSFLVSSRISFFLLFFLSLSSSAPGTCSATSWMETVLRSFLSSLRSNDFFSFESEVRPTSVEVEGLRLCLERKFSCSCCRIALRASSAETTSSVTILLRLLLFLFSFSSSASFFDFFFFVFFVSSSAFSSSAAFFFFFFFVFSSGASSPAEGSSALFVFAAFGSSSAFSSSFALAFSSAFASSGFCFFLAGFSDALAPSGGAPAPSLASFFFTASQTVVFSTRGAVAASLEGAAAGATEAGLFVASAASDFFTAGVSASAGASPAAETGGCSVAVASPLSLRRVARCLRDMARRLRGPTGRAFSTSTSVSCSPPASLASAVAGVACGGAAAAVWPDDVACCAARLRLMVACILACRSVILLEIFWRCSLVSSFFSEMRPHCFCRSAIELDGCVLSLMRGYLSTCSSGPTSV
mmetsp:Transcript_15094/g.59097  ORF Transcript_15094/g.59097 Transcript_15094/m.59097 type:complete len:740 (-) Transcript_15094:204-2423(-)